MPALTSWVEGKSWAIRHRAALTTLDAIEKDPVASLPPPKSVKLTMSDVKHTSEHDIVEHLDSVTCDMCGQRAPRRAALLKRWLESQCQAGQRVSKDVCVTRQPTRRTTAPSILALTPGFASRAGFMGMISSNSSPGHVLVLPTKLEGATYPVSIAG